jgi:type II secretory pathway pseudopilin PulG
MLRPKSHSRAFTLIELLVIIGIIAILAAFAIPAIYKAWKSGVKTKTAADFQVISVALDAFKADTGDYPRVEAANTGFAVLCKALVAPFGDAIDQPGPPPTLDPNDPPTFSATQNYKPGDAVRQPSAFPAAGTVNTYVCLREGSGNTPVAGGNQYWAPFSVNDPKDGPGTKVRAGGASQGPYLQPDRIKMRGSALLDGDGNPILYFPASPIKPNINKANAFVARGDRTANPAVIPLFDANDNMVFFMSGTDTPNAPNNALAAIQSMLGDFNPQDDNAGTNHNGMIDSDKGESALTTGPYILWSPGNDGVYGPLNKGQTPFPTKADIAKCDDVTNFK